MTNCCSPTEPLDCAERAACTEAGLPGHSFCGMCGKHDRPRHVCGCMEAPMSNPAEPTESELAATWADLEALLTERLG